VASKRKVTDLTPSTQIGKSPSKQPAAAQNNAQPAAEPRNKNDDSLSSFTSEEDVKPGK